jgi:hypothetical protein
VTGEVGQDAQARQLGCCERMSACLGILIVDIVGTDSSERVDWRVGLQVEVAVLGRDRMAQQVTAASTK